MENILIGVADDEQFVHDLFQKSISVIHDSLEVQCDIVDFYDTEDLLDYCYDNIDALDALFLDINFGEGNPQGTDALPDLREVCPKLDIYMLSGMRLDDRDTLRYTKTYGVEFIDKPVRSVVLSSKIIRLKKRLEDYAKIMQEAEDNKELIGVLEDEYKGAQNEYMLKGREIVDFIEKIGTRMKNLIKKDTRTLIEEVFDNLEFSPLAIAEILDERTFDKRVYKLLKAINGGESLSNGIKKQPFFEWNIDKLYEYRYSHTGRMYVQERGSGQKALVYCLDYNHKKHHG